MKLTQNFSKSEFESKDGAQMPYEVLVHVAVLAHQLQALRNELNASISINSGYRSPSHNKSVGGASQSSHLFGRAADIVVSGHSPAKVAETIERLISQGKMYQGGLKAYATFTHYDFDLTGKKRRW
jgi:uncharacterized protein YcbK (DUF882 family)